MLDACGLDRITTVHMSSSSCTYVLCQINGFGLIYGILFTNEVVHFQNVCYADFREGWTSLMSVCRHFNVYIVGIILYSYYNLRISCCLNWGILRCGLKQRFTRKIASSVISKRIKSCFCVWYKQMINLYIQKNFTAFEIVFN